ncbi:hypothetical protein KBB96_10955 [Luteolibacter ambystomatis]|uniref:Uncharacterized protein n=1 Tax=Luteolibacter ambystomatis TaxID=2824561 RepID=A0A975G6X0_9BACT|nr:hypothetical protein [Luteolibacter ambystomatis]QUE49390.1 hypothetical protein KBB96_10955 [Luteolibacter ambystomatis]
MRSGFSLVITLMMMVLLATLALGLLSLSSVTLRSTQAGTNMAIARSNARLALAIALGQLQRTTGPDQRVTARAEILEKTAKLNPERRFMTGVWGSSKWDPTRPDDKTFVEWLVSTIPGTEDPAVTSFAATALGDDKTVATIVGTGSVASPDEQVKARLVDIHANGKVSGRYAYVTFDNNVKADFATGGTIPDDTLAKLSRLSAAPRAAIDLYGLAELKDAASKSTKTLVTWNTSAAAFPGNNGIVPRSTFHDGTANTLSLFTDVRNGGMRADLSSAFEQEIGDFNAINEFHNSGETNDTSFYSTVGTAYNAPEFYKGAKLGYLYEIPVGGSNRLRGPTWDLLRNHYRLYKRDHEALSWPRAITVGTDTFAARGEMPMSYSSGLNQTNGNYSWRASPGVLYSKASKGTYQSMNLLEQPYNAAASLTGPINRPTAERIAPVVTRFTLALGLVKRYNSGVEELGVSFDPYVTVLNPYNVPIAFDSFGMFISKMNPVRLTVNYTDADTGTQKVANVVLSANYYTQGSLSMRMPVKSSPYVLQAGEVKTISPERVDKSVVDQVIKYSGITPIHGTFDYNEGSGIVATGQTPIKVKTGTQVTLEIRGRTSGDTELDHMIFSLYYGKNHSGTTRNLDTDVPPTNNMFADTDIFDDPFVTKVSFATHDNSSMGSLFVSRTVNYSQVPNAGQVGLSVGALDIRMKNTSDDVPVFTAFNPRSAAVDPRDYSGGDRVGPGWDLKLSPITDISQLQLATDPAGHGMWGGGVVAPNGESKVVLYEVPRVPMTSPAQFQHADTSVTSSGGSRHIGNSFPNAGIASSTDIQGRRALVNNFANVGPQSLADASWAGNEAIWDRYFFSSLNYGTAPLAGGIGPRYRSLDEAAEAVVDAKDGRDSPFFNPAMRYLDWDHSSRATRIAEVKDYSTIAMHLAIQGGFNINSTSVRAWKAMLGSLRNQDVPSVSGGGVSYSKTSQPSGTGRYAMPESPDSGIWSGYRSLSDDEIDKLATAMVAQVKARGPFMGLADFVNRRLTSGSKNGYETGALGAMQMAIEEAGLNGSVKGGKDSTFGSMEHRTINVGSRSMTVSTATGAPQYLMQADILSQIGAKITARSDTFTIRTQGQAVDTEGNVAASAWCEAIVQRTPEWTVPTTEKPYKPATSYPSASNNGNPLLTRWQPNTNLPAADQKFGRVFQIVSFRWLKQSEV